MPDFLRGFLKTLSRAIARNGSRAASSIVAPNFTEAAHSWGAQSLSQPTKRQWSGRPNDEINVLPIKAPPPPPA